MNEPKIKPLKKLKTLSVFLHVWYWLCILILVALIYRLSANQTETVIVQESAPELINKKEKPSPSPSASSANTPTPSPKGLTRTSPSPTPKPKPSPNTFSTPYFSLTYPNNSSIEVDENRTEISRTIETNTFDSYSLIIFAHELIEDSFAEEVDLILQEASFSGLTVSELDTDYNFNQTVATSYVIEDLDDYQVTLVPTSTKNIYLEIISLPPDNQTLQLELNKIINSIKVL